MARRKTPKTASKPYEPPQMFLEDLIPRMPWGTQFIVYGDGAGFSHPHNGGWCTVVYDDLTETYEVLFGNCSNTTNNEMELMQVVRGLQYIDDVLDSPRTTVWVVSDSQYVVYGAQGRYRLTGNRWLWKALEHFKRRFTVEFEWFDRAFFVVPDHISKWASRDARDMNRVIRSTDPKDWKEVERDWRDRFRPGSSGESD